MKNIISHILVTIISLFVGINGTIYFYEVINEEETETVNTNVNITENETISESIDKVYDAVFTVESSGYNYDSIGTAFAYKYDDDYAYLLTNHHVIEDSRKIEVSNNDGEKFEATLMGSDEMIDLAVLRVSREYVPLLVSFGDSTAVEIGDTVFAVGTPISLEYRGTVTKGIISGLDRQVEVESSDGGSFLMDVLQTNTAINPGNSGGPLVNINGEVIGINTLKLVEDDIEGMGFAIPIEMATSVIDRLEEGEAIERPYLGVSFVDANDDYALNYNKIVLDKIYSNGVVVVSVERGSVAETYGLQYKDVILKIDGVEIVDGTHLKYKLYQYQIGDKITFEVERDGKIINIEVILEDSI